MNEIENKDSAVETVAQVLALPVSLVHRSPYQVRRETTADPDLVSSIAAHGLVHPITVREDGKGGYELIAGHRRFVAYVTALPGEPIPATVVQAGDREAEDMLVTENFMRLDLSVVEKAVTIRQLRDHGRTVPEVAALTRLSERSVFRFMAIGAMTEEWRDFLHAWDSPYESVLKVARLPAAVQKAAWESLTGHVADALTYTVRKGGDKGEEESRRLFLEALRLRACGKAEFLDYIVRAAPSSGPKDAAAAEALVRRWFDGKFADFLGAQRLLDPQTCPFDCRRLCKGCAKRSDAAPDLFDEDDPARTTPRCHDAECWRRKADEAAVQTAIDEADQYPETSGQKPDGARGNVPNAEKPGTDGIKEVPRSAPPSATSSDAAPESGKKGGTSLSDGDLGVRMGVVWCVAQLLCGDKLEDILPKVADLRADVVRRGGWRAHVRDNALPRLTRNQEAARVALISVEGMW